MLCLVLSGSLAFGAYAQDIHVRVSPKTPRVAESDTLFPTIQMALDHAPYPGPQGRLWIQIEPGAYHERIWVSRSRARTTLVGMGKVPEEVVITASQRAASAGGTFFTGTVDVEADDFQADNLTFANTAGNTGQALAISVQSDRAIFKHCRFLGDQDTLFADFGRQYYVDSYIEGGVDFVFGNAAAVFDRTEFHLLRKGYVTAQSRTAATQQTGFVLLHARLTADPQSGGTTLGRPWRAYSRTIVLHTELPAEIDARGWSSWDRNAPDLSKVFYAEYGNTGPGAHQEARVPWSHQLTQQEAARFYPNVFLQGNDHWDPEAESARLP